MEPSQKDPNVLIILLTNFLVKLNTNYTLSHLSTSSFGKQ